MLTKKMPKNAEKFSCEKCGFTCSKKSNYETTKESSYKGVSLTKNPNIKKRIFPQTAPARSGIMVF